MVRKIKGFSLIELLIVIVIISILMAIIYKPISQKIQAHKVEGEIKKVYSLLQEGRMTAFTYKKNLRFSISGNQACLYDIENNINIKCITVEVPFWMNSTYIDITDRGIFNPHRAGGATIRYSGSIKVPTTDCIKVSITRVRLGVWNGSTCNLK